MGDLKFVPQSLLDAWADLGKITLTGTSLYILAEEASFTLTPAIRFLSLLEGQDTHELIGKVKSEVSVKDLGGEVMTDSCLVGDTAYEVQPGFLAESEGAPKPTRKNPTPAGGVARPTPAKPAVTAPGKDDETELLTRFLLESLD